MKLWPSASPYLRASAKIQFFVPQSTATPRATWGHSQPSSCNLRPHRSGKAQSYPLEQHWWVGIRVTRKFRVEYFGFFKIRVFKIQTRNLLWKIDTRQFGYLIFRVRVRVFPKYPKNTMDLDFGSNACCRWMSTNRMTSTAWTCASVEPLRHPQTAGADRVGEGPVVEVPRRPGRRRPPPSCSLSQNFQRSYQTWSTRIHRSSPQHSGDGLWGSDPEAASWRRNQRCVERERERERDEFLFAFCVLTGGGMRG